MTPLYYSRFTIWSENHEKILHEPATGTSGEIVDLIDRSPYFNPILQFTTLRGEWYNFFAELSIPKWIYYQIPDNSL